MSEPEPAPPAALAERSGPAGGADRPDGPERLRVVALCVGGGGLVALALPPWGWWPLAFVGIALVDMALDGQSRASRFRRGYLAAATLLFPTLFWIQYLTLPGWLVAAAAYSGMFALGFALLPDNRAARWVALAGMWTLVDLLRSKWPFEGVPMSTLALGQVGGPLAPIARLGGLLLLELATAAAGVALAMALRRRFKPAVAVAALIAVLAAGGAVAPRGHDTHRLRVAIVQGGGPQGTRADTTATRVVFDRHMKASDQIKPPVDLVVWPEDVVDVQGSVVDSEEGRELADLARRLHTTLVAGVVEDVEVGGRDRFHNAAVVFGPDGKVVDRYEKVHRVPFGEYTPLRWLLEPIVGGQLIDSEAIKGHGPPVVDTDVGRLGVVISWEVFFPDRARAGARDGATVVLNPTNGASFRGTLVQTQQVAASRLRAIETGKWVLQVAPTGFSAVITPTGHVVDRTAVSEQRVIQSTIANRSGRTPATAVGDWPALLLALGLVGTGWWLDRRRRGRPAVSDLEEDGHRALVDELDVHLGAEPAGLDRRPQPT
jgi:apolipoprotein N-acyltransferase